MSDETARVPSAQESIAGIVASAARMRTGGMDRGTWRLVKPTATT